MTAPFRPTAAISFRVAVSLSDVIHSPSDSARTRPHGQTPPARINCTKKTNERYRRLTCVIQLALGSNKAIIDSGVLYASLTSGRRIRKKRYKPRRGARSIEDAAISSQERLRIE